MAKEIVQVPVSALKLDWENPRLAEGADVSSQSALMNLFYDNYVLEELAASYVANGFFPSEHLLVLKDENELGGVVLEGNRRLAALKFLLHDSDAAEAGLPEYQTDEEFTVADRKALAEVPVLYVNSRDEIWAYLGFRHISGPKEWSPAAKARYVSMRIDEVAKTDPEHCFKIVGKEIGSNAGGARNMYIQYAVLRAARDEHGLYKEATYISDKRFGVWERLLHNAVIYDYIGLVLGRKDYSQINSAVENLNGENLALLIRDMVPDGSGTTLLNDSRLATSYATIVQNPVATKLLRETGDFESSLLIAQGSSVNVRLRKVDASLDLIESDLDNDTPIDGETMDLVRRLVKRLFGIKAKVEYGLEEHAAKERDGHED